MSKKKNQPKEKGIMPTRITVRLDYDTALIVQQLISDCKMNQSTAVRELIRHGKEALAARLARGASQLGGSK